MRRDEIADRNISRTTAITFGILALLSVSGCRDLTEPAEFSKENFIKSSIKTVIFKKLNNDKEAYQLGIDKESLWDSVKKPKTIAEAETCARKVWPDTTFDFKGASLDTILPTIEQYYVLSKEWPEASKRVVHIGTDFDFSDEFEHSSACMMPLKNGKAIYLNKELFSSKENIINELQYSASVRISPKGRNEVGRVITHEFMHVVKDTLLEKSVQAWEKEDKERASKLLFITEPWERKYQDEFEQVCIPASKDTEEAFAYAAESYYHANKEDRPECVKAFGQLIPEIKAALKEKKQSDARALEKLKLDGIDIRAAREITDMINLLSADFPGAAGMISTVRTLDGDELKEVIDETGVVPTMYVEDENNGKFSFNINAGSYKNYDKALKNVKELAQDRYSPSECDILGGTAAHEFFHVIDAYYSRNPDTSNIIRLWKSNHEATPELSIYSIYHIVYGDKERADTEAFAEAGSYIYCKKIKGKEITEDEPQHVKDLRKLLDVLKKEEQCSKLNDILGKLDSMEGEARSKAIAEAEKECKKLNISLSEFL